MSSGHSHGGAPAPVQIQGSLDSMVNLHPFLDAEHSAVLNADARTNLKSILGLNPGILRSDSSVDHELIVVISFREAIKLRGLIFLATEAKSDDDDTECSGPANIKVFVNRPNYTFSECEAEEAVETIKLTKKQIEQGEEVKVKFVKFQNVSTLTLFFQTNQDDSAVTFINKIDFIGQSLGGTNMKDLKAIEHEH